MIQVFRPTLNVDKILEQLKPVLESGWIGLGPKTKEFENKLSNYIGSKYFVALNSATSALHLAVKSLNLPTNSKIITTPNTFVSTNHAILYEGHVPIFCDVEKTTGNISVDSIKQALLDNEDIKAIIVVHVGGYSCDMDSINQIAKENNLKVIEDCAHAFGGKYKDKMIGDTNNICIWSFQAVKNLPVGDGGAISTNDEELYNRLNKLRWLGINKDTVSRSNLNSVKQTYNWDYEVEEIGYKYHASDITSVIGIIGLETIEDNNKRRREIAKYYLDNIKDVIKPEYENNRISSSHFLPLFFLDRENVYSALKNNEIYCGMHYKRNDKYRPFDQYVKTNNLINADWYENHELTLPLHLGLNDYDVENIVKIINNR